jgi:hypothetical protein
MDLSEVVPFLGCSNVNPGLVELLRSAGADIGALSKKELRETGMDGIELKNKGLSLTFSSRDDYIETYAEPTEAGDAILVGIFAYGAGSRSFKPYPGLIPFSRCPVTRREEALLEFGEPYHTESDDGEIDWDYWMKNTVQVGVFYRADASIKYVSFSVPFRKTRLKYSFD